MTWQTIALSRATPVPILALGAWLKNTVGLWHGNTFVCSPVHGDLGTREARQALDESVQSLCVQARAPIQVFAHDAHPDFYSTQVAQQLAVEHGGRNIVVQHHVAHIAGVQAEQNHDQPILGLALDGVGLGTDGTAWGGELLLCDLPKWQRLAHLTPLMMAGGDVAARESWRMAAAALMACGRADEIVSRLSKQVGQTQVAFIHNMLTRGVNCPQTNSAGRWFDAVAGVLGFNTHQTFEAQAAIALEQAAQEWLLHNDGGAMWRMAQDECADDALDMRVIFNRVCGFADSNEPAQGAAYFHLALAASLVRSTVQAAQQHRIERVALSGGCFFNAILRQYVMAGLLAAGLQPIVPQHHSCGDAGLPLGQAWFAYQSLSNF